MDKDNKNIKKLSLVVILMTTVLLSSGCASKDPIRVAKTETHLVHPQVLQAPENPGVSIRVITKQRIDKGELPDKAYVGFEYNEWLEFAKWMHKYRAYNKSLQEGLDFYKAQDTRNVKGEN